MLHTCRTAEQGRTWYTLYARRKKNMTCTVPRRMQLSKQGVDPWIGPHDSQASRKCQSTTSTTHNTKSHKPAGRNFNIRVGHSRCTTPAHHTGGWGCAPNTTAVATGFDSLHCTK